MDPIAHSLVGASLSETGLKRLTHLATPTLVLAANAPDIDIVSLVGGNDFSLGFRRGWTHGVLALAVLPLALAGLMLLTDRVVARLRHGHPRGRAAPVLALSYIGVLTHPLLDWLNTYGIRLLMPFDDRWFYGDALFIIDPWVWLLSGAAVVVHTRSHAGRGGWLVVGVTLTALVLVFVPVPPLARVFWVAGIAALVGLRVWSGARIDRPRLAITCLAVATLYITAMVAGSRRASDQATQWLADRGIETAVVAMAGPLPANPFTRDIVVRDDSHYHFLELRWFRDERVRVRGEAIDRGPFRGPIVAAALTVPQVQGVTTWMRFPAYTVASHPDGYTVTIRDVRYSRFGDLGLGTVGVELDRNLGARVP